MYPPYWIVCILILLVTGVSYLYSGNYFTLEAYFQSFPNIDVKALCLLLFSNATLLFQDLLMFLGLNAETGQLYFARDLASTPSNEMVHSFLLIPPAWSISLEIMFYLIAPFLVKRKNYVLFVLIGLSFSIRAILHFNGFKYDPWNYRFFPSELMFFLLGILAYRIYKVVISWDKLQARLLVFARIVYATVIVSILAYPYLPNFYKYPLFLIGFFISLPFIFLLSKRWIFDRQIGELSYPLYIAHIFVLSIITRLQANLGLPNDWIGELCFGFTLCLAVAINELVLKKIEQFRQSRVPQNKS